MGIWEMLAVFWESGACARAIPDLLPVLIYSRAPESLEVIWQKKQEWEGVCIMSRVGINICVRGQHGINSASSGERLHLRQSHSGSSG